jgi:hypothetical protein
MLELLGQCRHRFFRPQLTRQLGDIAHHEPLVVAEQVHQLGGALLDLGERAEDVTPLVGGGRGDESVEQHLRAGTTGAL